MSHERARQLVLNLLLAGAVLAVYGQVGAHGFVEYDDPGYVRDNPFVGRGFTWDGVRWAFTTGHMGNWNPLTWFSHMLDVQLFGVNPGPHHLVSVAIHLANTLLLFAVLQRMTRAVWPSFIVAALFGLHPLHVESVAWISERKDVLSTLLWLLTLWAYTRYVEARAWQWYAAALLCFALGLMAKPMLVTVPFVLLLLDLWPFGRLTLPGGSSPAINESPRQNRAERRRAGSPTPSSSRPSATPLAPLVWEKAPFLLLTVICSAIAYATQLRSGAVTKTDALPLGMRLANALVAYVRYLIKAIWPADLAVLYPYDTSLPAWQPIAAALCLGIVSLLVLRGARRHPYALVGWLWYLGTLVPVIGLVQIGSQALADRYTYVPLIGVFIMLAWGGRDLLLRWPIPAAAVGAVAAGLIGMYAIVARAQVDLWKSGESLLSHTVRVTGPNCIARNNLGVALAAQGRVDAALEEYQQAVRIKPDYADPYNNIGLVLWRRGQRPEAAEQYRISLRYQPDAVETHTNLGLVLTEMGRTDEAIAELSTAIALDPQFPGAHVNLGNALRASGRTQEALAHYEEAKRIKPDYADAYNNVGIILAQQGRRDEALAQFHSALQRDPRSANAHTNLALILLGQGKTDEAIAEFAEAARLEPDGVYAHRNLGAALRDAGRASEAIEQYEAMVRLNPDRPETHYELGVTLIQAERPQDAIAQFERALQIFPDYAEAHNDLGVALVGAGRLEEAIGHIRQALRLKPDLPDAQINIDLALAMQESAQRAAEGTPSAPTPPAP